MVYDAIEEIENDINGTMYRYYHTTESYSYRANAGFKFETIYLPATPKFIIIISTYSYTGFSQTDALYDFSDGSSEQYTPFLDVSFSGSKLNIRVYDQYQSFDIYLNIRMWY